MTPSYTLNHTPRHGIDCVNPAHQGTSINIAAVKGHRVMYQLGIHSVLRIAPSISTLTRNNDGTAIKDLTLTMFPIMERAWAISNNLHPPTQSLHASKAADLKEDDVAVNC